MCSLIGTVSQVSDAAHGPLVKCCQSIFTINNIPWKSAWSLVWTNLNFVSIRVLSAKFSWNWLCGSGEKSFKCRQCMFAMMSPWKRLWPLIWAHVNPLFSVMLIESFSPSFELLGHVSELSYIRLIFASNYWFVHLWNPVVDIFLSGDLLWDIIGVLINDFVQMVM